jgi:hypothetical protein
MVALIYRRVPLETHPKGGFLFALHFADSNCVQYGLGYESANGLQRRHVATEEVHQYHVHETADLIENSAEVGVSFKRGPLDEMFPANIPPDAIRALAQAMREVHDEAWGHPLSWEPIEVSLNDGRFIWLAYDSDADRVRLGIGYYDEQNEGVYADNSYMFSPLSVADWACQMFSGDAFFCYVKPPRWNSFNFDSYVCGDAARRVAIELIRLADAVWPGRVSIRQPS